MDKNYGLPLKFKMTCQKTGRDSFDHELSFDRTPIQLAGANLYRIEGTGASNFDEDPVIRQATGFTDAAGKDVYFGDVLCKADFSTLWFGRVIVDQRGQIKVCKTEQPYDGASLAGAFDLYHIVGNAYEPPARWLERAREIWPGAVLPEGDKCL